jgi:gliding motility-associated protein GldC
MTKNIRIAVDLDDKRIPQSIAFDADEGGNEGSTACRAMILALWDHQRKDTLRLDLWTHDMTVDEMKIFFHETLVSMAETLKRSTADERIAGDMADFCDYFAEKMEIAPRRPDSL